MAGKIGGRGMGPNSEPNVIPFIDIMLVLLIIFMVAAPKPTVDIKVDLPPPGKVVFVNPDVDKPTIVVVSGEGAALVIKIGEEVVPQAQFDAALMRIAAQNNPSFSANLTGLFSEAKIFVDADAETSYYNVVDLINDIDTIGFKKVSLLVKEAQT